METWNERLATAMRSRGIKASEIAQATRISDAGIKKWIDGATKDLKYRDVIAACRVLKVSPEWLMSGFGDMDERTCENSVAIELVDIKAACGTRGCINFDDIPQIQQILVSPEWFRKRFAFYDPKYVKLITAQGDSMAPDIEDNDALFLDTSDTSRVRDGVYATLVDGELYIKRIQKMPDRLVFISSNKAYQPFEVMKDSDIEVIFLGRVIKTLKLFEL